jgi:hypothetical protein
MRLTCPEALRVFIVAAAFSLVWGEATAGGLPLAMIVAQAGGAVADDPAADETAGAKAGDNKQLPEEQKQKVKTAVLMLSILSGIALSGLLLIIAAIAVRGMQRKLAGPTRLDRQPQDVLPEAVSQPDKGRASAGPTGDGDGASEETLFT